MSTQPASLKRKIAPATKAAIDKPPTPTPTRKKSVAPSSARTTSKPSAAKVPPRRPAAEMPPASGARRAVANAPASQAPARPARVAAKPAAEPARRQPASTGRAGPRHQATPEPVFEALLALRFHPSHALRAKALRVLDAIDAASHPRGHGEALADLVAELVVAGMDWYFLRPLQRAQVGFMAEQSARLGLNTATKMINSASRGFILRMDLAQLRVVAGYMREIG